jgi:hypothetical protein
MRKLTIALALVAGIALPAHAVEPNLKPNESGGFGLINVYGQRCKPTPSKEAKAFTDMAQNELAESDKRKIADYGIKLAREYDAMSLPEQADWCAQLRKGLGVLVK